MSDAATPSSRPTTAAARRRGRDRSPSYPGIDLAKAIDRARVLYREERRNAAPVDVILRHWGYKPRTGPGLVTLAALKKFGLLVDEGSLGTRKARLTDAAIRILLLNDADPERLELIRRAALLPAIHAQLWEEYRNGGLPSDPTLRRNLILDRGFTEGGATDFIAAFKRTLGYAKLGEPDNLSERHDDMLGPNATPETPPVSPAVAPSAPPATPDLSVPPVPTSSPTMRVVQLPAGSAWATLQVPTPMTEEGWALMMRVLEAMKPGLVPSVPPDAPDY